MPVWLSIVSVGFGLVSASFAIIMGYRNVKNTNPTTKLKQDIDEINEKLDNDNYRISRIEKKFDKMEELDRLVLRSFKGMLTHCAKGNHTDVLEGLIANIDDFLINR